MHNVYTYTYIVIDFEAAGLTAKKMGLLEFSFGKLVQWWSLEKRKEKTERYDDIKYMRYVM